ncbi:PilZ domain-containing protein [Terrihabitans sp. B22-R8]|uniref:PilZ domain-containing protein n=1 Tax=Terrihabitans sp. B22-R8 TaxID=3425128 RepID=UPI00403D1040
MAPDDNSENKRSSVRMRTLKGAQLIVANGFSSFDCIVRNMSAGGALVELPSTIGIPSHVTLRMKDGSPERACHVAWRTDSRMGLRFLDQ